MRHELLESLEDKILYRQQSSVKAGQIRRFKINFTPHAEGDEVVMPPTLWVKIKNTEPVSKRAIYLAGPYILYVDCRSSDYDPSVKYFVTADQPAFEPQLLAGQSFYVQLSCHTLKSDYSWIVDVVSQIIFNNTISINFEITVGTSKQILHDASTTEGAKIMNSDKLGTFHPLLHVTEWDTHDLWNLPSPQLGKPKHLVVFTHGLHSNASVDMLYLKEQIDEIVKGSSGDAVENEEVIVKAFFGNIAKTERGIKYLGSRVAEYIVSLVTEDEVFNNGQVSKISFVGHSLGGCVQTFAIAYLRSNFPWFFEKIKPINFIAIASPLLGVVNENPLYVKMVLSAGFLGKAGQELGLKLVENESKPLLLLLPTGLAHRILKRFKRRTVYANATNDGIVPLRTSALLFLDYKGLATLLNSNQIENIESTGKVPKAMEEDNLFSPVQAFLSYFMPQKQKGDGSQYKHFQCMGEECDDAGHEKEGVMDGIPSSTFLDSAAALVLPPMPSMKYIVDPSSRENVILHDKVYFETDLPRRRLNSATTATTTTTTSNNGTSIDNNNNNNNGNTTAPPAAAQNGSTSSLRQKLIEKIDYSNLESLEEEIAREYHKSMSWRKVVVKLKPDAHNNIIVRRRFANAYGWPVIQHLVETHFSEEARREDDAGEQRQESLTSLSSTDSLDDEPGLTKLLSRDLMTKENHEIDENNPDEEELHLNHEWINSKDNAESLFALGVTGLIGEVTGIVGDFGTQLYNYSFPSVKIPLVGQIPRPGSLTSPHDAGGELYNGHHAATPGSNSNNNIDGVVAGVNGEENDQKSPALEVPNGLMNAFI
ncbi:uncharacterized protein LODBEIA_P54520 [Lodderomyces beijingensis]|uniref:DUF676 domain-containing protein n=1 Tax=Lodderomyces beijingensis TaxID=1775926 RepID=A0ABP0ZSW8_9ASCO